MEQYGCQKEVLQYGRQGMTIKNNLIKFPSYKIRLLKIIKLREINRELNKWKGILKKT